MVERTYTVAQIDRMRSTLTAMLRPIGQPYNERELEKTVERRLRTYLLAGVHPDELDSHARSMRPSIFKRSG